MNFCEREILQGIRNSISAELSQEQIISSVANEISRQNGLEVSFVQNRLNELFAEETNTAGPNALENLMSFFSNDGLLNGIAYNKTKKLVRNIILERILSGPGYLVRSDSELNNSLKALIKTTKRYANYTDDIISPLVNYLTIELKKEEYFKSPNLLANYLIINHLPTIIQSWFKDIIHYNTDSGLYEFNVKHDIRNDWKDTDDKEAELNAMLEIMLKATPLCKFNADGEVEDRLNNRTLNRNTLFASISEEINAMPEDAYIGYLENPYSLIDYLVGKYSNTGAHSELYQNVLHSFLDRWIYSDGEATDFYENSKKQLTEFTGFNPVDIFLKSFDKYRTNTYIDYNLSGTANVLSLSIDENSTAYGKLSDYVSSGLFDLDNPVFKGIFIRTDSGKYILDANVSEDTLSSVSQQIFGESVDIDAASAGAFKEAIQQIVDFKNQTVDAHFSDFLQHYQGKDKRARKILVVLNKINAYNPYSIKGSSKNALGKALPMIGLSSVAGTVQEQIYRNRLRKEKVNQQYQKAGIEAPVSPFEQTILFKHKKNSEENLFLRTIYRSTVRTTINGEEVIKDVGNLSNPEAFKLAFIEDFWNSWKNSSDSIIRIQAITPSDKPRIPLFEFSSTAIKNYFGKNNSEIEPKVLSELRNIYAQNLTNTIRDFALLFNIPLTIDIKANAKENSLEDLLSASDSINTYLQKNSIGESAINDALFAFNNQYGTNKNIAMVHDYVLNKGAAKISPYMMASVDLFNQKAPFDSIYKEFLSQLSVILPTIKLDDKTTINVRDLLTTDGNLTEDAKKSPLYTYFLIKNVLSENILANTVGVPLSHKNKGKDYISMDSGSHLTMVKRMVALTATMHSCMPNVLSGLSNQINTMTIANDVAEMFAYSGNASSGKGFRTSLEVADGAMFSCRFSDNLLKQSLTDVKPKGNDLKLLMHSLDPEKGFAYLSKLADFSIDNAWLRKFSDDNIAAVGGIDPLIFVRLSLEGVKINPLYSINEDNEVIDYDGNTIAELDDIFVKENGVLYLISNVTYDKSSDTLKYEKYNSVTGATNVLSTNNNLYSIWKDILGGEYSCDENGVYGEQSMDTMTILLNRLGNRLNNTDSIDSQNNIDQYAKKAIVHYFPTSSSQKSAKTPVVDLRVAEKDLSKRYTTKMNIENFGIQLDPDHSAEDGEIHEITQLISFITENNYVPEKVKRIYQNLSKMVSILKEKTFIDPMSMVDENARRIAQEKLDNLFGKKIERIFADPTLDVMGLANELMREIQHLNPKLPSPYKAPYSDHQMLGKLHTTVGSYFNKFIARLWSGRGDVLVPSHNMCMLYEDESGITYFKDDIKYLPDGSEMNIKDYLRSLVWEDESKSLIREDYIEAQKVSPYEVMPVDVYYLVNPVTRSGQPIVIDTWDKLNAVRDNILKGFTYVRALDLPRNLRSKQAFITNGSEVIGMYHFKTMQQIADISNILDSMGKNDTTNYNGQSYTFQELFNLKKSLQKYFSDVVLNAIASKNTEIINKELPEGVTPMDTFEYVIKEEERLTTNNYRNAFGIDGMNVSEILQKKEAYFKEKLQDKFQNIVVPYNYLMYASNGKPTAVITDPSLLDLSVYKSTIPVVDEDGFRLDALGNKLYKWPDNAKLYKYTEGKITVEMIYTNEEDLNTILDSNPFVFYRSDSTLSRKHLYNLNSDNVDQIFDRVARKQYDSWLKSNDAVMSRIPAQALAFAMVIKTAGYLPWGNNVTMVPNMNVFLEGSDYDIDKAYAIMAALDRNGIYKEMKEGELTIIDSTSDLGINLSNEELEINVELGNIILNNTFEELPNLISKISGYLDTTDIRLNKEYLLDINNLARVNIAADEDTIRAWGRLDPKEIGRRVERAFSIIKDELVARSGLENSNSDQIQAMQNYILESIKGIYRDPRTLMASTDPTTMDPVNDTVKDRNLEAAKRNHLNPLTDIFVNQTTSVGKKDIGISAVAQKAFYALTYYYNLKQEAGDNVANYIQIPLPADWRAGSKNIVSFGYPGQTLNLASYEYLYNLFEGWETIDTKVTDERTEALHLNDGIYVKTVSETIGDKEIHSFFIGESPEKLQLVPIGSKIGDFIPTTINSSVISSSTDNAKEMKMDLLNATPEILPAYEFCLSLGVNLDQAAAIFTDPLINVLITISRGDLFNKETSISKISKILSTKKTLARVKTLYGEYLGKPVNNSEFSAKIKVLEKLFAGAEELTSLGQLLGINGGIQVEFGSPLLFQLKIENTIKAVTKRSFSFEKFLNDPVYAKEWIGIYDQSKINFNLLDIINSVPHYREMFSVPIQFKRNMQLLSKDIDNTYTIAYKDLSRDYQVDDTVLRSLLRLVNDRKIFDFFISEPFEYESNRYWKRINNNNSVEEVVTDTPIVLSTDTFDGLISLKPYIERVIIPELKRRYPNNSFASNLIANSIHNPLFGERITFIGSRVNLSDPQYEDTIEIIKNNFYGIQNDTINGHSIYEWMYIYDLLVNKHAAGGNSITMLLDGNLNIEDPDSIVSKWVRYVNKYDKAVSTYANLEEVNKIPDLKDIFGRNKELPGYDIYEDSFDPLIGSIGSKRPSWAVNPTYLPLFVSVKNFGMQVLLHRNALSSAFAKGIVTIKLC